MIRAGSGTCLSYVCEPTPASGTADTDYPPCGASVSSYETTEQRLSWIRTGGDSSHIELDGSTRTSPAEVLNGVTQRVRRNRTIPQPLVRLLHIGYVRIRGVRISVPVIRVESLNLLVVCETPSAKALLQQRSLRLRRRKRNTLSHLTNYHNNSPPVSNH